MNKDATVKYCKACETQRNFKKTLFSCCFYHDSVLQCTALPQIDSAAHLELRPDP